MSGPVAVIVAAFQAERFLGDTLASVRAQTYRRWTCWVVDDGSTDATADVAERAAGADPRIRVVRQANAGPHLARNAALALLPDDVEWVALLDSDDLWVPEALATLVRAAERRPDAVGVHALAEYVDAEGRPVRPGAHPAVQRDRRRPGRFDLVALDPRADSTFESLAVSGTIWPPATALLRREVVDRVGRFDPAQRLVEDWDLYLRMSRHGPFAVVDTQVAWYRQHGGNLTHRAREMAWFHARVRWNLWSSADNTPEQRRTARRVWRRLQVRWVVWAVQATLRAVAHRRWGRSARAASAAAGFARQLLAGHPAPPSERLVDRVVEFVVPRQNGAGLRDA